MVSRIVKGLAGKLMVAGMLLGSAAAAHAAVFVSVGFPPPALPVYVQPICPGDGYLWTPGYWAYGPAGYFWVPGVWVQPPGVGLLWTPGYWGWGGGAYLFHAGYWGPHIGFYGGVNYGFGYSGHGYEGGAWVGGHFSYNRAVNNINVANIHNTYVHNVTVNNNYSHASYNGGTGGVQEHAQASELAAARENHVPPTGVQQSHQMAASQDRGQLASVNGGHPQMTAAHTANEYHNIAANHATAHPITQTDRAAGTRGGTNVASAGGTQRGGFQGQPNRGGTTPSAAARPAAGNRPAAQASRPAPSRPAAAAPRAAAPAARGGGQRRR